MKIIDFPDLSETTGNPLGAFYSKIEYPKHTTHSTDFIINSEDCALLKQNFEKWVKAEFKNIYSKKRMEAVISFNWNNMCPRDSLDVPKGKVHLNF